MPNLWGKNPETGKAELYILRCPPGEMDEYWEKAKAEGWTLLTWGAISETFEEPEKEEDDG